MSTNGEVALAVWLIVADVTTIAVLTLPLLNQEHATDEVADTIDD